MNRNFDHAHSYLSNVGQHFQQIMAEFDQEDLYEHDRKLDKELFQTYFNMSVSIAREINDLEQKNELLDQKL